MIEARSFGALSDKEREILKNLSANETAINLAIAKGQGAALTARLDPLVERTQLPTGTMLYRPLSEAQIASISRVGKGGTWKQPGYIGFRTSQKGIESPGVLIVNTGRGVKGISTGPSTQGSKVFTQRGLRFKVTKITREPATYHGYDPRTGRVMKVTTRKPLGGGWMRVGGGQTTIHVDIMKK